MTVRTVRVETSMPGWSRDGVYTVDDDIPLIAALIATGRLVVYTPPAGQVVTPNLNDVIRLGDINDPDSPGGVALRAFLDAKVNSATVRDLVTLTQTAYDALPTKVST